MTVHDPFYIYRYDNSSYHLSYMDDSGYRSFGDGEVTKTQVQPGWFQDFASLPDEQLKHWRAHGRMTFPDEYRGDSYTLPFSILADAERHDVIRTRPRLDLPVHIVHGDADAIVPLGNTRRFIAQSTIPRLTLDVVPGGDHRLSDHLPLLTRHLAELWQETES